MYADNCTDNQVCKIFEPTDGTVTWDMLAIPKKKARYKS